MSKKINTSQLENELHQSKFFTPRKKTSTSEQSKTSKQKRRKSKTAQTKPFQDKDEDERSLKRYSHDLYVDQVETLETKLRVHFLTNGEDKSKAQMIREAIDAYIEQHT